MTEPDVTLTDYLLAAEAAILAWMLARQSSAGTVREPFVVFFAATSVASLAGGTVHGFFLTDKSAIGVSLWRFALVALGVAALAGWTIGARILFSPSTVRAIQIVAFCVWLVYAAIIAFVKDSFWIAVVNYLPVTMFLIVAFAIAYRTTRQPAMAVGTAGLALTVAAAVVQQLQIALHPRYFNHNTLYHFIQAIALLMIFWAARSY